MTDRKNTAKMSSIQRGTVLLMALIIFSAGAFAQKLPSVAVYSLSSNDVADHVSKTVDDLVYSFVRELRSYRIIDLRNEGIPEGYTVPDGTDYIFYGTMTSQRDGIKLELVLKGGPSGITRLLSRVYENTNRILLESRLLVRDLFDQSVELPDPRDNSIQNAKISPAPAVSEDKNEVFIPVTNVDSLAGSWQGEDGIDKIMILRGGRGVAVLSSGVSISLEIIVSGEDLVIKQKGVSNPRQFTDLPDPVAKQAASVAPPLEWRFLVSLDQKKLSGTKKSVTIRNDGKNILSMENEQTLVSWIRE